MAAEAAAAARTEHRSVLQKSSPIGPLFCKTMEMTPVRECGGEGYSRSPHRRIGRRVEARRIGPRRGDPSNYARIIRATTGASKIRAVSNHQFALSFLRNLPLKATITAVRDARPLMRARKNPIRPRLRQPMVSTGIAATTKKAAGKIAGSSAWRRCVLPEGCHPLVS